MTPITQGKLRGLEALSDTKGVIRAAAMDQRGSLLKSIAKAKGVDAKQITDAMLSEFKVVVTKVLTFYASAILLDPEYGLEAVKSRNPKSGVLLAYESSGYDNTKPGRLPDLLEHWSVGRLVHAGADAIKILIYYHPDDKKKRQRHQTRFYRTDRRRVRGARRPILPRICRLLMGQQRGQRVRIREGEAADGGGEHARVFEARVRCRRPQG